MHGIILLKCINIFRHVTISRYILYQKQALKYGMNKVILRFHHTRDSRFVQTPLTKLGGAKSNINYNTKYHTVPCFLTETNNNEKTCNTYNGTLQNYFY